MLYKNCGNKNLTSNTGLRFRKLSFSTIFHKFQETKKIMRKLNVSISDIEYNKFGLKEETLTFTDFIKLISKELTRQNLSKCLELAEKYGMSKMTMDEIADDVKAVRQNAKNRN